MNEADDQLNRILDQWGQDERKLMASQPRPPRTASCPAPHHLGWFVLWGLPMDAEDELSHILQCNFCTRWFITYWMLEGRPSPDVQQAASRHPEGPTATLLRRLPEFEFFEEIHGHVSPEPV